MSYTYTTHTEHLKLLSLHYYRQNSSEKFMHSQPDFFTMLKSAIWSGVFTICHMQVLSKFSGMYTNLTLELSLGISYPTRLIRF